MSLSDKLGRNVGAVCENPVDGLSTLASNTVTLS